VSGRNTPVSGWLPPWWSLYLIAELGSRFFSWSRLDHLEEKRKELTVLMRERFHLVPERPAEAMRVWVN
jgi:hypothetical protein